MTKSSLKAASTVPASGDIEAVRHATNKSQADAADPTASVWVNANAGTGKTHVLTLRVMRILLSGTSPERILCLTYTKAAAAEMSKRIFDRLGGWVTAPEAELSKTLEEIEGIEPDAQKIAFARTLFARAIETPGGLKIQTIHAFSERLLQRFPLEAGVPPGFAILDDEKGRDLKNRAIEATLLAATSKPESPLGKALTVAIRYTTDASFDDLLARAITERTFLDAAARWNSTDATPDYAEIEKHLRKTLGARAGKTAADIEHERGTILTAEQLAAIHSLLISGKTSDIKIASSFEAAFKTTSIPERGAFLSSALLKTDDEPRQRLMTKALIDARPDLHTIMERAQERCFALTVELKAAAIVDATTALYRLAGDVLNRYQRAKSASGALDFEDLIEKTRHLLSTKDSSAWVLYKLDGGLDHILVDEAQDTSPDQWDIIDALGQDFFVSNAARDGTRTIFAVGDEKQSIYSFQGAEPERFATMGERFASYVREAARPWRPIALNMSFRTVDPVLKAVDAVFANPSNTPGLTADVATTIRHIAHRAGEAGLVEIWETERATEAERASPWSPLDDISESAPANRLAERIADTIQGWLQNQEILISENRPIREADILILVRKRNPFAVPMVTALKRRGIAVAGSDRIRLTDQIAVQDLLALGDVLTLPEDDLALATVLKSPLFSFDDDDLLHIAPKRKGALWKQFLAIAKNNERYHVAAETLKRWRAKADFTPPFEFFSSLLDREGARLKMLARLGPEAADAIDEFLDLALAYDDSNPPSLTGFLANLRAADRDAKRDMDHIRNEVRVMTVHGAKGLEAPIVFLPDTCTTSSGDSPGTRLLKLTNAPMPSAIGKPFVWPIKGTSNVPAIRAASDAKKDLETAERNRLLYVAMTRARDRLYITGFEGSKGRSTGCWYDIMHEALSTGYDTIKTANGSIWRTTSSQLAAIEKKQRKEQTSEVAAPLPGFAHRRAAAEPQLSIPLAPSRLEPYAPDEDGEPLVKPQTPADAASDGGRPSPSVLATGNRFLRGNVTHALLQYLPDIPEADRATMAAKFVAKKAVAFSARARQSIVNETLAILATPAFAPLFSPGSRPEVPISAEIPRPSGEGPALRLSGQIDRLAVTDHDILIVDYKTNRPPPREVLNVAPAYLYQLAAYTLALKEIYPGRNVRAALLWTDGPHLMPIPSDLLEDYASRLWALDVASLDATTVDTYVPQPKT